MDDDKISCKLINKHKNTAFLNHFYDFVGCDAIKHNEEESEHGDEKGVAGSGYNARGAESSVKMKTDNGYAEDQPRHSEHHLDSKSSSVMHEETSDDSYLQVNIPDCVNTYALYIHDIHFICLLLETMISF